MECDRKREAQGGTNNFGLRSWKGGIVIYWENEDYRSSRLVEGSQRSVRDTLSLTYPLALKRRQLNVRLRFSGMCWAGDTIL